MEACLRCRLSPVDIIQIWDVGLHRANVPGFWSGQLTRRGRPF